MSTLEWTDERVGTLKRLWGDGCSAGQIAARLGGVTRNSVIGKVHRLGLSGRATNRGHRPRRAQADLAAASRLRPLSFHNIGAESAPEPFVESVPNIPDPEPQDRRALHALKEVDCRWPLGDPLKPGFGFCGRKKCGALPYCEPHARMAYKPVQMRRRGRVA